MPSGSRSPQKSLRRLASLYDFYYEVFKTTSSPK